MPKTSFEITTQAEIRADFWAVHPELARRHVPVPFTSKGRRLYRAARQNEYPAEIRTAFVEYVDALQKSGRISETLADRVTL